MAVEGLYIVAAVLIAGAAISKVASQYKFPYPIVLILLGILLRQVISEELLDVVGFDFIASLTLASVLFYAGLTMNVKELRLSLKSVILLATAGVILTSIIAGVTISLFSTIGLVAFLIGAILSPTDPAALFSVLESGGVKIRRKLISILEGEAVFNDATAVVIVITVFLPFVVPELARPWYMVIMQFVLSLVIGSLIGAGIAFLIGKLLLKTGEETNIAILTATTPILAYGVGELFSVIEIHPGALAAVSAGIFMANFRQIGLGILPQKSMRGAMKQVSFTFEIIVFIMLGFSLDMQVIVGNPSLILLSLMIAALIILVARPASVFLVTMYDKSMTMKDRFFVSWAGVKGVASAALAAIVVGNITDHFISEMINTIVFIVLLTSLTLQGLTTSFFATRLGLIEKRDLAKEIVIQRDGVRQALLHLVDKYTEGKIDQDLYLQLKAELEEEIFNLEDQLKKVISEKRAKMRELEMRKELLKKRVGYYRQQLESGSIESSTFEEHIRELELEIDELDTLMRRLQEE